MARYLDLARRVPVENSSNRQANERNELYERSRRTHWRVWSEVLGEEVILARDDTDTRLFPSGRVVYWQSEWPALVGVPAEQLRLIHAVKEVFAPAQLLN